VRRKAIAFVSILYARVLLTRDTDNETRREEEETDLLLGGDDDDERMNERFDSVGDTLKVRKDEKTTRLTYPMSCLSLITLSRLRLFLRSVSVERRERRERVVRYRFPRGGEEPQEVELIVRVQEHGRGHLAAL
jgi:hypothetical protein